MKVAVTASPPRLDIAVLKLPYPVETECFPNLVEGLVAQNPLPNLPDAPTSLGHPFDPPRHCGFHIANDRFRPLGRIAGDIERGFVEVISETEEHARQLVRAEF